MRSLIGLFARSPFAPLKKHMDLVSESMALVPALFQAVQEGEGERLRTLADEISRREHLADIAKNEIRNQLPRSLFLPIDRSQLLRILALQDSLADTAEDLGRMMTLKPLKILKDFQEPLTLFLEKNMEAFRGAHTLIEDLHELFESSFGGLEAKRVKERTARIAFLEHEADLLQHTLLEKVYAHEEALSFATFYLWQKIFEKISAIANLAENMANTVRTTIETQ